MPSFDMPWDSGVSVAERVDAQLDAAAQERKAQATRLAVRLARGETVPTDELAPLADEVREVSRHVEWLVAHAADLDTAGAEAKHAAALETAEAEVARLKAKLEEVRAVQTAYDAAVGTKMRLEFQNPSASRGGWWARLAKVEPFATRIRDAERAERAAVDELRRAEIAERKAAEAVETHGDRLAQLKAAAKTHEGKVGLYRAGEVNHQWHKQEAARLAAEVESFPSKRDTKREATEATKTRKAAKRAADEAAKTLEATRAAILSELGVQ